MLFRRKYYREEPEINFIPLIDVLLVILIFLMVTTTYSRMSELQITLPQADADNPQNKNTEIVVAVDRTGQYAINRKVVKANNIELLIDQLKLAAGAQKDPVIVIQADAQASHQSVIQVMEAARNAGYARITFATERRSK